MKTFDIWLYPDDLEGENAVVNIFRSEDNIPININEYKLPENWKEIVTQNGGLDEKLSIHDIMVDITTESQMGG